MERIYGFSFNDVTNAPAPGATITVFNTGTLVLATIYSDALSTPKANPFTSDGITSYWYFYAAFGGYDVQVSGTGIATYVLGDVLASSGIGSLNGLSGQSQTFATGTAGTDFAISSAGTIHTFNIPSASATNRGLVTTTGQTFAGTKTFSTPIAVGSGGTGLGTSPSNGQLLIGNGSNYTLATLTGTANQISIAVGAGSTTISTPQNIGTGSSPTFQDLTLTGGLNVGFSAAVTADFLAVGDALFALDYNTANPQVLFDTSDSFRYTRGTNLWQWFIGGVEQAALNTNGLTLASGLRVGFAGNPTADKVQIGDAVCAVDYNTGNPQIIFDTNDVLLYTRASNQLDLFIGGASVAMWTSSGLTLPGSEALTLSGANGGISWTGGSGTTTFAYAGSNFRLQFDSNDYIQYNTTNNILTSVIGGATITTTTATFGFAGLKGSDVASAAAIVPTGNLFHVTGTTNITSITSTNITAGQVITIIFDGALTFTDGSNLKLAGNFVTTADDTITLAYDGTNWYEMARSVN